ncbi:MAG: hypothetical protein ACRDHW_08165, partial [Ktedonobacteraceae bacterium]
EPEEQHAIEQTITHLLRPLSSQERRPYTDLLIMALADGGKELQPFITRAIQDLHIEHVEDKRG